LARRQPRFASSREQRDALAQRFLAACEVGDLAGLEQLLATEATFYGDGGGKVPIAIRQPVHGRERVARLLNAILFKKKYEGSQLRRVHVNGQPGAMILDAEDRVIYVFALEIADGLVHAIRSVINPDKLQHLGPVSEAALHPPSH
jgi:RNA polymerase sigma-70 factor (ECF subfamily)